MNFEVIFLFQLLQNSYIQKLVSKKNGSRYRHHLKTGRKRISSTIRISDVVKAKILRPRPRPRPGAEAKARTLEAKARTLEAKAKA